MNNNRRKVIRAVIKELKSNEPDFDAIESDLTDVLDEETEAMENTPESLQDTDRYSIMEESCDLLQEAIDEIDPDDADCIATIVKLLEQIDGV